MTRLEKDYFTINSKNMQKLTLDYLKETEIENTGSMFANLEIWKSDIYLVLVEEKNWEKFIYRSFKNKDK